MSKETQVPRTNEADPNGGASIAEAGIRRGGELSFSYSPSIVTLAAPHAEQAEAIRTLRTHIMAQHVDDGRRGLAICGPSAGVGCSFTAVNLAVALSQIGVNTLLIDGDLRKPSVQDLIRPSQPVIGLRQALGAEEAEDGIIQTSVLPNLSVMFSGGVAPDAQELLASDRFKDLVDEQLRDFDMTIIDNPGRQQLRRCAPYQHRGRLQPNRRAAQPQLHRRHAGARGATERRSRAHCRDRDERRLIGGVDSLRKSAAFPTGGHQRMGDRLGHGAVVDSDNRHPGRAGLVEGGWRPRSDRSGDRPLAALASRATRWPPPRRPAATG
jgi:capsular exopolysaccharide synthesis family protein